MAPRAIEASDFTIVANGVADGPAQALRDYLVERGARRLTTIFHPLVPEDGGVHEVRHWRGGKEAGGTEYRLPSRPPLTYPLDLVVPPWPRSTDGWFGFNGLACARGLAARRLGRAETVVYWCVDYVDERFGRGVVTRAYDALDRLCCVRADARFELSEAARRARDARHADVAQRLAPASVVPMGAWLDRVPTTSEDNLHTRRVVYLGHLVERQGVATLIRAVVLLRRRGVDVRADVVGRGPLEAELQELARDEGVADAVAFHGFLADHRDVERILAAASIGAAPYVVDETSFTQYADPGKLKAYLAAGLPIVTTRVSPNADELERVGAAVVVSDDAEAFAAAVERVLAEPDEWRTRHRAALEHAARYDWASLLGDALGRVGFR